MQEGEPKNGYREQEAAGGTYAPKKSARARKTAPGTY